MSANHERTSGAVDQEAFEKVIRDNLSPEGVATIIAFLQPATMNRPATEEQRKALLELEWFANTLMDLIGNEEYARLLDELCL
jgi:CRISPR/Cas system-associated endonuclease Cas3-HD